MKFQVVLISALSLAACDRPASTPVAPPSAPAAMEPPPASTAEAPAVPTGDAPVRPSWAPQVPPSGSAKLCDPVPGATGPAACPQGCLLVQGAPVFESHGCVGMGPTYERQLACLRLPLTAERGRACFVNTAGERVLTPIPYPGLEEIGWAPCEAGYDFRVFPVCVPPPQ
jgi:hypothetical protein